jgi:sugar lactone lactonase YvrE
MFSNRRCGFASCLVLAILAFLVGAPFALPQAVTAPITMVQSSARFAGSSAAGYNGDFGAATTVSFSNPSYLVFDSNGNQFVSDTLNNCVRRIDTAGNITTVAGLTVNGQGDTCNTSANPTPTSAQGLYRPTGLAIDSTNRLYIADSMHHCIRSLANGDTGTASLTTVAGTCGTAATASVTPMPNGLAIDAANNLLIALQDSTSAVPVYQVVEHVAGASALNVCLVAGAASANVATACAGVTNGIALMKPSGLAFNLSGDLYLADTGNNCVRKIAAVTFAQSTALGQCLNDGSGSSATAVHNPYGLAVSPMQTLFISESNSDNIVSYLPGASSVTIVGGMPSGIAGPYSPTQDGKSALSAPLNGPRGIAFDSIGDLFVADSLNNITRKLSSNLYFPTTAVGSQSATQPITLVINRPVKLFSVVGSDYQVTNSTCVGDLYPAVAGAVPNTCQIVVRFNPAHPGMRRSALTVTDFITGDKVYEGLQAVGTGALSLFTPGAAYPVATGLASPSSIVTDASGNAYVLETATAGIRFIPAAGGASNPVLSLGAGLASTAAVADAAGNWYVADATHGTVSRFGADGSINAAYVTGLDTPIALALDLFNNLSIAQAGAAHNVIVAYTSGARRVIAGSGSNVAADGVAAINAAFVSPSALAIGLNGILYVADQGAHRVYAVDKAGILHVVAEDGTTSSTAAALTTPTSLAVDAAGDLYIADQSTGNVYVVYASSSTGSNVATVLTTGTPNGVHGPINIALDGSSNLFVSLAAANSVLKLSYLNPALDFGNVSVGTASSVKLQSITNVGNETLNLSSPLLTTDSHFAPASGATTCGTTILTGSVCTVGFTFTPTSSVAYTASSPLASNSPNTTQSIALIGTGKQTITLTTTLAAATEVYGQTFAERVTFGSITTAPTGTVTFTTAGQTLCTQTGTFSALIACSASASGLPVGQHTVTFNYSGDSNYAAAAGVSTLTVTPAPLSESVHNSSRNFGAANPAFTGALTGVASGDTILVAFTTTAAANSPVGNYPVAATLTAAGSTNLANYVVTNAPGTLTIQPAALVVTANSGSRATNTSDPTFTGTSTGLFQGDAITIIYRTTASLTSPAGSYPIVPIVSGAALSNYTLSVVNGALSITATGNVLVVDVRSAARIYGTANPVLSGVVSGVIAGDNVVVTYSTAATTGSSAGSYPIAASISGTSAGNYIATIHPAALVVAQAATSAAITVSAPSTDAGGSVVLTTTVTATSGTASGIVNFFDGSSLLGNANLNSNGSAVFTTNTLGIGSHRIATVFQTNTNFTTSTASIALAITPATTTTVPVPTPAPTPTPTVIPVATVTTVSTSTASALSGASILFTANVTAATGTVAGVVSFFDGTVLLGSQLLEANGKATLTLNSLTVGSHTLSAAFQPNSSFTGSSASVAQKITQATGSFTLAADTAAPFIKGAGFTTYQVTVKAVGAFGGPVNLTCAGLPASVRCTFATPVVTLAAGATATTTMTVMNTIATVTFHSSLEQLSTPGSLAAITAAAIFPAELTGLGLLFAGLRRRKSLRGTSGTLNKNLLLIVFTIAMFGLMGCGIPNTSFKTYTINITGTSLNFPAAAQTTSVDLSVGQQ